VGDVVPRSPAEKAGIKSGDVILEVNNKVVADSLHLKLAVGRIKPGETVPVKILRKGDTKTVDVTIKEQNKDGDEAKPEAEAESDSGTDALQGVGVSDLDRQTRQELKVPATVKGAVISSVEEGSVAAEAGLKVGDVITEINHQPVRSAEDAVKLTEHPKNRRTLVRVWSSGITRYVVVDESKGDK
jgi:serine protease Do